LSNPGLVDLHRTPNHHGCNEPFPRYVAFQKRVQSAKTGRPGGWRAICMLRKRYRYQCQEDSMHRHVEKLALTTLLALLAAINGALAQTPPGQSPPHGLGAWITGHPVADLVVVVAIFLIGAYLIRQRSRV
jgi:hypothetical protein